MERILFFTLTFLFFEYLSSCNENIKSDYKTYSDVVQSGYFRNRWIPKTIPTDSKNIEEIHNIDNNKVFGRFTFDKEVSLDTLTGEIDIDKIIEEINLIDNPSRPTWFPSDTELRKLRIMRQDNFYILIDLENKIGYFVN